MAAIARPKLSLKRIGRRGEEHYDVLADGTVVGRIMMFADTPAGKPWCGLSPTTAHPPTATSRPERPHAGIRQEFGSLFGRFLGYCPE